jgi:FK506-binding nuclear protein
MCIRIRELLLVLLPTLLFSSPVGAGAEKLPEQTKIESNVQGQDVTVGTGETAVPGSVVSVLYIGKLQNGILFDSSEAHGNEPLEFTLGQQGLIAGFQIGVNGMKEGGERLIAVPPSLGYGTQEVKDKTGKVVVPAGSTLLFNIKLIKVHLAK